MELSFSNVGHFCFRLDYHSDPVVIDLKNVTFIRPFALIYLGMMLRYFNSQRVRFELGMPDDSKVRSYLAGQNFYERFNFDPQTIREEHLFRIEKSTSLNDIIDIVNSPEVAIEIADRVKELLIFSTRAGNTPGSLSIPDIWELVSEIVDNFSQHSEEHFGSFMIQYYPNLREISIAIGDSGIGIRKSLCMNESYKYLEAEPDSAAITESFEPLVSRIPDNGMGLYQLKTHVIETGGTLYCSSGNGYVRIDRNGRMYYGRMPFTLPGVQIEFNIPDRNTRS